MKSRLTLLTVAASSFTLTFGFLAGWLANNSAKASQLPRDNYELVSELRAAGLKLHVYSPRADGDLTEACYLTPSQLSREEVASLVVSRGDWDDVVLVEPCSKALPSGSPVLTLGPLLFSGDPELAEEISRTVNP